MDISAMHPGQNHLTWTFLTAQVLGVRVILKDCNRKATRNFAVFFWGPERFYEAPLPF